jgi:hypothetical protein
MPHSSRRLPSIVRFVVLSLLLIGVAAVRPERTSAKTGVCNTHGLYTDRLCPGDGLGLNQYIVSPNGDYRLIYQTDGWTGVYNVTTNPWTVVYQIYSTHDNPGEFVYTGGIPALSGDSYFAIFDSYDEVVAYDYYPDPDGDHALVLGNDGCPRILDQDGGRTLWALASC